jgi:hypothetical protein
MHERHDELGIMKPLYFDTIAIIVPILKQQLLVYSLTFQLVIDWAVV